MKKVRENGAPVFDKNYLSSNRIEGYGYDSRGNLTTDEEKAYFWDNQNRLTSIMDLTGQYLADYRYDDRGLRISSLPPAPDINVRDYPTDSSVDFTVSLNVPADRTFTIDNIGHVNLTLTDVSITGQDASLFTVQQEPTSPVPPNQSTTFVIRFLPTSTGDKSADLLIISNDPDENPYKINLEGHCEPEIEGGGPHDFGTVTIGESTADTFYIQNIGTATLILYAGWPISIEEPGGETNFYLEGYQGDSRILPAGMNSYTVRFAPVSEGLKTATISIENSDLDENPCTITLTGTGENGPMKIIEKSSLIIVFPNGGEELDAGSFRNITWKGGDAIKCAKIEYSTDNGSTYHTIVERAANIGTFPWVVPSDLSESCLIRISDADGAPTMPVLISYEFNFRVSVPEGQSPEASHFTFRAGLPDPKSQSYQVAEVSFAPDGLRGCENLLFNYAVAEVQSLEQFLGSWHHARIMYDMTNYSGSVWIDSQPVLSNVPLNTDLDVQRSPEISLSGTPGIPVKVWIDDVDVRFLDQSLIVQDSTEVVFKPLFRDNFNRYERALFPRQGGWIPGQELVAGDTRIQEEIAQEGKGLSEKATAVKTTAGSAIDDAEYASSSKSFKLEDPDNEAGLVVKRFSLPVRTPFCVSAENFVITAGSQDSRKETEISGRLGRERADEREDRRSKRPANETVNLGRRTSSRAGRAEAAKTEGSRVRSSAAAGGDTSSKLLSGIRVNSAFYIYSFDGRLLAEYNISGQCVRDYIYFGGRLIAEYREYETEHYYYYTSDQINSTRIVTDSSGTVVYAAAHDPYGGIQKTWEPITFDPSLKFSGKEHDEESELDYFGARYYDKTQYRFISIDPIINPKGFLENPQSMNLYSFCINNPVSYMDPDGRGVIPVTLPGTEGKSLFTWLDARFAVSVNNFINFCANVGIDIEITSAYRTMAQQAKINPDVKYSLHSAGWAIDINWNKLDDMQTIIVGLAAAIYNLEWGGYWPDPDNVHFYGTPSQDRVALIEAAAMSIAAYDMYGTAGLSDNDLYMLYGVFTQQAADRIAANAFWALMSSCE
jgi:RHS repeat-associated protein